VVFFMAQTNPNVLISTLIFILFAVNLIPVAITSFLGTNTTGWSTGAIAIWGIADLVLVAGIIYKVYNTAGK